MIWKCSAAQYIKLVNETAYDAFANGTFLYEVGNMATIEQIRKLRQPTGCCASLRCLGGKFNPEISGVSISDGNLAVSEAWRKGLAEWFQISIFISKM